MTTLQFIGTGGAFDPTYGNSAALVQHRGATLLLDCGFAVYPQLVQRGLTAVPEGLLLTHLHNDHCGSLANWLLHRHYIAQAPPPIFWFPAAHFRDEVLTFLSAQIQEPEKYLTCQPLTALPGVTMLDTFGRHSAGYQSYAYLFETDGERLVYSGDLHDTDFLFAHLATLPPARRTRVLHDISFEPNNAHTHYERLQPHLARYPELFGYHCDPTQNPADNPVPLAFNTPELML